MDDITHPSFRRGVARRRPRALAVTRPALSFGAFAALFALFVAMAVVLTSATARGDDPAPFAARAGLDLAFAGAQSWAPDAYLTYVENDEDLDAAGGATRWGYLFYSPSLDKSRAYSVRDGKILVAENLDMKFDAPPLAGDWIDSVRALEAADAKAGHAYRQKHQGTLATMLLMRGAFQEGDPDEASWTVIYTSPTAPALFVMVDASGAKVRRTWRG